MGNQTGDSPSRIHRLLRWGEKHAKTDLRYLAKSGFWLTTEQILIGLTAFGVSVAFARFVPKEVYGTYRFLLSLFWTLTAFSLTGIGSAMSRAVAKGEEGAYRQALRFMFLGSLPMSLIAGGLSFYYFYLGNSILGYGTLAICLIGPFFQTGYLFGGFLEGKKDFRRTMTFGVVLNIVPALSLLALMPFARTPLPFFLAYLGSNAIIALLITWFIFRAYRPNRIKSEGLENLGWHFSAMNILGTIANQLDQLLVFHYLGAVDLAIYSIATALPDQLKSMVGNLTNIAFPKFVTRSIKEIRKTLTWRIVIFSIGIAMTVVVYVLLAPLFFRLFFPTYTDSIFYSQLYALALLPLATIIPTTVFQAHGAKKELYIFSIASSVFQILSLFVGIFWFGLIGIISARIVARFFNLGLNQLLIRFYGERT